MAMTPEEYAARELNVPGWEKGEPLIYAPGFNPSEQDPNILAVLNGDVPEPTTPQLDQDLLAMVHEHNFTIPLELRRAELITEDKKHAHLEARTAFWNCLSLAVVFIPILAFIAVLVK